MDVTEHGQPDFLLEAIPRGGHQAVHELLTAADTLGHDDDAVVVAAKAAAGEVVDDLLEVVAELGNHRDLRTRGDGAHQGKVALIPAHHLDDEAAVVGGGGGLDHVDQVDDGVQAGVRADAEFGVGDVVVDGTGQSQDAETMPGKGGCTGEGAVSAKDEEGLDVLLFQDLDGLLLGLLLLELQAAAGGKNGAGVPDPAADLHGAKGHELPVKNSLIAVLDAENLDTEADPGPDDGPDGGVHSGGVPPGGDDGDAFEHFWGQ